MLDLHLSEDMEHLVEYDREPVVRQSMPVPVSGTSIILKTGLDTVD